MTERTITISNRAGVHARPAALIVEISKNFRCSLYFEKDGDRINGKSIMGLLTLGAAYGTEIKIITDGEGEEEAMEKIIHLFDSRFEED